MARRHKRFEHLARAAGVAVLASACAWPALAGEDLFDIEFEQLEQIIVTAQKREQNIEDVPISVVAFSGLDISQRAVINLQGLSAYVPGVTINEAVIDNNLFIRGIGSGVNAGFERSVGTYIDGVYVGRAELSRLPFLDVERVEVLKGPQGILFGKNTIGGALNLTTVAPADVLERQLQIYTDPEHADTRIEAVVSGPLSGKVSGRLAASVMQADGYFDHLLTDDEVVEQDHLVVRGKLRWQPSTELAATLKLEHADFSEDGRAKAILFAGAGSSFAGLVSEDEPVGGFRPGAFEFHDVVSDVLSLNIDYDIGEHRLTAITGYLDYSAEQLVDALSTPYFVMPGDSALFVADTEEDFYQISQEVRLLSPQDRVWSYLVGVYAQLSDLDIARRLEWPVGGETRRRSVQEGASAALFAQLGWAPNAKWRVSAGARLNAERKDFERRQRSTTDVPPDLAQASQRFDLDRDIDKITGALQVQYQIAPGAMGYFSFSTGFKDGGFDEAQGLAPLPGDRLEDLYEFDEETVNSIELGGKFTLDNDQLALNIALFRSEYDDLQTSVFDGVAGFLVANAASSITQGLEIDLRWRATPRLQISAAATYLDAYYDSFTDGPCSQWHAANSAECVGLTRDLSDDSLPFAPELSANLNVAYRWPLPNSLDLSALLDVFYSDEFFTASDLDPITRQGSYVRYDLRVALAPNDQRWEVALIGKNLSDEFVSSWRNDLTFSGEPGRQNTYTGLLDPPRTIALQAKVRF